MSPNKSRLFYTFTTARCLIFLWADKAKNQDPTEKAVKKEKIKKVYMLDLI
ncbi:hypothetical protein Syun_016738 [Stephania yunnanensis]|uniref:Uncharacterized protein n=1 Tax=Stephania yunnanensis TaxID=152371 RepID=A0AAP0J5G9_9MAGN